MTRRCRCTGSTHTCGIQSVQGPNVVYVGQGGPRGPQGVQGRTGAQGTTGVQGTQGLIGQGAQGIQGPQGGAVPLDTDSLPEGVVNLYFTPSRVAFVHTQNVASNTWFITHNLNFYPNITVKDSGGSIVEGEVAYTNANEITLTFSSSFSGTAYLS